ncbi:MAG TPA: chemotaxis protein CheW, partial [Dongiaceae bacterium]|nr:chemotaxis protein CheW [Dongiaceae bacterium]
PVESEPKEIPLQPIAEPSPAPVTPVARSTPSKAPAESDLLALETESAAAATLLPPVQEWHDNGRPTWAQGRFECLIFTVAGLKLAVPLITLGAIHRIDRKFNALPHQSEWFLGILQTQSAGNIKVLDTALCVMPERYDPAGRDNLGYVITIHGYPWGLACHQVEKSISLEPEQIKWRTQRGKRPWLAGTVIEHMCALIDTDGFHDLILKAERPR